MPGIGKILQGIMRYRKIDRVFMVEQFKRIKENPEPTAVFITCIDSRILATRFTYSEVGDNLVVRNAGNLVPHSSQFSYESVTTEAGALELGCVMNNIKHVVVCGHSDCKAMNLLYTLKDECCDTSKLSPLQMWVKKHGYPSLEKFTELNAENMFSGPLLFKGDNIYHNFTALIDPEDKFNLQDKLSQVNTLVQLQNISSYPFLKDKLQTLDVRLHAMWFDVYTGNVYMFSRSRRCFVEINEQNHEFLLREATAEDAPKFEW